MSARPAATGPGLLDGPAPLLSVPFQELSRHVLSGSLVPVDEVLASPVSPELRDALCLLRAHWAGGAALQVVVRPEMFTHGAALAWLRERTGAARAHLCLSDGASVRVLPGLANHAFFHGIGQAGGVEGFLRLRRRAPELLAGLAGQVNTSLALVAGRARRPRSVVLARPSGVAGSGAGSGAGPFVPFLVPREGNGRDAQALAGHEPVVLPAMGDLTYVAAGGAALGSAAFVAGLVHRLVEACTRPDSHLVIGAPAAARPEDSLAALFCALRRQGLALPSGIVPNVFLHLDGHPGGHPGGHPDGHPGGHLDGHPDGQPGADAGGALPGAAFGGRSHLVAHESDAFWRRGAAFHAPFGTATVLRERVSPHHAAGFHPMLVALTGRAWRDGALPDGERFPLARCRW